MLAEYPRPGATAAWHSPRAEAHCQCAGSMQTETDLKYCTKSVKPIQKMPSSSFFQLSLARIRAFSGRAMSSSLHRPSHSVRPHGFRNFTSRSPSG